MNEHFSFERLAWLLRADLANGYRSLLTASATLAGVMLIASLISFDSIAASQGFFVSWYGGMLYIWGIIATSRAFTELHDKAQNEVYLLIPASPFEKTIARLLAVTAGLSVYLLVFTTAASLLVWLVHRVLAGAGFGLFNPLDPQLWPVVTGYLFLQSFYFLGAAWFARRHLVKTTLVIVLAGIGLGIFTLLTMRVVFAPEGIGDLANAVPRAIESFPGLLRLLDGLWTIVVVVLPLACWSIAWLRVRETQVSDGV